MRGDNINGKSVAVFGAGIAGLSAAQEFATLGYKVSVYEADSEAGGFYRSARIQGTATCPPRTHGTAWALGITTHSTCSSRSPLMKRAACTTKGFRGR